MKTIKPILAPAGVALMLGCIVSAPAVAESLPSAKATFAFSELINLPSCASTTGGCSADDDSEWHTVLKQKLKLANQKDLFIDAALQCGIVTDTTVKSLNAVSTSLESDGSEARGTIRVRVKITAPDGTETYAYPQTGAILNSDPALPTYQQGTLNDGIVYCDRIQRLEAKFSGLSCTAAPYIFTDTNGDLIDDVVDGSVTCLDPEELRLLQKTLNASSFNFVAADLSSGVHTIEVEARTTANVSVDNVTSTSLAGAEAFIGAGAVAIESVRMIKGNSGVTLDIP